jgi:hypothetical protein
MFEDAKVDAFLVRLHTPSNRVPFIDVDPSHNVALLLLLVSLATCIHFRSGPGPSLQAATHP